MPRPWKPGQSGNPAGRPPKSRALTAILEAAGNKTVQDGDKRVAAKRALARMLWDISTTGRTIMPDGSTLILDPGDWVGLVKWIYSHIDGPPKAELDVTSEGMLRVEYVNDWRGTAATTPSGADDGTPAGETAEHSQRRPPLAEDDARDGDSR